MIIYENIKQLESVGQLSANSLVNADCLEAMKYIADKSIDCIIADLPYGQFGTTACKWDCILPFKQLFNEYNRIIKDNGIIALTGIEPFTSQIISNNIKYFREKLVWVKHKPSNIGNAKVMHLKYFEDIVIFCKGKPTYNPQMQPRISDRVRQAQKGKSKQWRTNRKDTQEVSFATEYKPRDWNTFDANYKYPSNVISIPAVVSNSKEKVGHPTQKPVALMEYLIKTYTNEGETVLDNTMGSGTTGVACKQLNRSFIGIEMDDKYFEIAKKRINDANPTVTLFSEFRGQFPPFLCLTKSCLYLPVIYK